jgi:hypothetical protein
MKTSKNNNSLSILELKCYIVCCVNYWAGSGMVELRNTYKIWVGKPEMKISFWRLLHGEEDKSSGS